VTDNQACSRKDGVETKGPPPRSIVDASWGDPSVNIYETAASYIARRLIDRLCNLWVGE
jgi:hypothetical protein